MTDSLSTIEIVIWGIITFSILVVLHEMGHFLAARAFGVKVHEFMVGLPGPAIRLHTKNMAWGITAIPLGGYVRISGMEPGPEDELLGDALALLRDHGPLDAGALAPLLGVPLDRADAILTSLVDWKAATPQGNRFELALDADPAGADAHTLADRARATTYRGQATWKRVTILAMGVITNLTVAILTFTVVLSVWGYLAPTTTVETVGEASPAQAAGMLPGDTLIELDGEPIDSWDGFQLLMAETDSGQSVTIRVDREGARLDLDAVLDDKDGHGFLGVGPKSVAEGAAEAGATNEPNQKMRTETRRLIFLRIEKPKS